MDSIIIKFNDFEGPMDLLIELIKKRELNIYDLPMSIITKDFIRNIEHMKNENMEVTAQFTSMASLLLHIKSQMLLPSSKDDPRLQLVKEIEDYEKYKENLEKIKELQFIEKKYFKRTKRDVTKKKKKGSILDIIKSYQTIMHKKQLKERNSRLDDLSKKLTESKHTIEAQMRFLKEYPLDKINVQTLFEEINDQEEMIVTFSALLELIKLQVLRIEVENEIIFLTKDLD